MSDEFLLTHYPGSSPELERVRQAIEFANGRTAIALRQPVLILGESGTGKGYVAELLSAHRQWLELSENERRRYLVRRDPLTITRYQSVLLPGLPENLVESELFGHKKGAFTGADRDHPGIFASEVASEVLLDEVGDASAALQEKLLEVLESGEYRPVGGTLEEKKQTQLRVLMATNKDLPELVRKGLFREDLYWRVSQIVIRMPPLREQRENMREIMASVLTEILARVEDVEVVATTRGRRFTDEDVRWAMTHEWPGNVRELARLARLWLIDPARRPLAEISAAFPIEDPWNVSGNAERLLHDAVDRWLDEARSGRREPPGTVEGMMSAMSAALRHAVSRQSLNAREIRRLFPAQAVENVRSRLSKWKRESTR